MFLKRFLDMRRLLIYMPWVSYSIRTVILPIIGTKWHRIS